MRFSCVIVITGCGIGQAAAAEHILRHGRKGKAMLQWMQPITGI